MALDCCFHLTGRGTTHGWGGADEMQCCNCGKVVQRRWKMEARALPDHGPHVKVQARVYDPVDGFCSVSQ